MVRTSIIGGSGYTGGELLRLLVAHPETEVVQVTSRSHLGEYVYQVHPNLRKQTTLKFTDPGEIEPVDVLFLALPHGQAQHNIEEWAGITERIIDLSADFRLKDPMLRLNGWRNLSTGCRNCIGKNSKRPNMSAGWVATLPPATWHCCH
jgi:N-acetyl-gamma-glutamyl-phosphate/LysW-gamma-L-alpha-aminoadipyl-6-phosphate reductase